MVGSFVSEDRLDYTVIGNSVNRASRLEAKSKANKVLISEDTYLLIKKQIKCIKNKKYQLKNFSSY